MADVRVTQLPAASSLNASDVLHGVQAADAKDKKFSLTDLKTFVNAGGGASVASVTAGAGLANSGTAADVILDVGAGTGIAVAADSINLDRTVVDTWYAPIAHVGSAGAAHLTATTSTAGFMSAADKTKLDGVATGATANTGTVTNVATGTGLTGGPITTTGSISLANTAVAPGSYTHASITVDQQGRITAASSGSVNAGTVTSVSGTAPIVITGTATTTPNVTVTAATTSAAGVMSAADKTKLDGIAAGAQPGTVTSVTGTAPISVATGTTTPAITISAATEAAVGAVELATAAETTTGTDNTRAVHPAGLKVELDKKLALAGGTMTGGVRATLRTITSGAAWDLNTGNLWTFAGGSLANPSNATAGMTGVILVTGAITAYGSSFQTQPATATVPCVIPFYVTATNVVRVGTAVAA